MSMVVCIRQSGKVIIRKLLSYVILYYVVKKLAMIV